MSLALITIGLILVLSGSTTTVLGKHPRSSSSSSTSSSPESSVTPATPIPSGPKLTPPPCVNNTSTSGPFTDYENLIRSLYHCEHIDINVLHESPNSTMVRWYDDKAPPGGVQDKEGELNFHELSHEDNGFMTTVVLVPNP
jgi:hypothetical protein